MNAIKRNPVVLLGVIVIVVALIFKEWAIALAVVLAAVLVMGTRRYSQQLADRARREIKLQSGHKLVRVHTQFRGYWHEPSVAEVRRSSGRKAFYPIIRGDDNKYKIDYNHELGHVEFARATRSY